MQNSVIQILNRICWMIIIPIISIIHVKLNTYRPNLHYLKTMLDDLIPFKEIFVIPYIYWFFYVFLVLVYFAVVDYKSYFRLLMSIVAGMFVCFIIFYFYPTTVLRHEVLGNDKFSWLVKEAIYKRDNPYNCFPSIHVLNSLLVTLFFCKFNRNLLLRIVAIVSCILISLSTLFIKQHYAADVIASTLLGAFMYVLFTNDYLWGKVPVKRIAKELVPSKVRSN